MIYVYALLIMVGGFAGLLAITFGLAALKDLLSDIEWTLHWTNDKYRKFKEKILPKILGTVFAIFAVSTLIASYMMLVSILR